MKTPLIPSAWRVRKMFTHSSTGTSMTLPPIRATAAILVRGAVTGTITVQGTPSWRAE